MSNVLDDEKQQQILSLGRLGWTLRRIEEATAVRRETASAYLKAGVVRACLYDPDANAVYAAFAKHWGFTALPIRPANPQENGKQERAGCYVKDNALKGRRFDSLDEKNAFLKHWNRTVARLRIHGTTRRQVWSHFLEVEKPALGPLPAEPFAPTVAISAGALPTPRFPLFCVDRAIIYAAIISSSVRRGSSPSRPGH